MDKDNSYLLYKKEFFWLQRAPIAGEKQIDFILQNNDY